MAKLDFERFLLDLVCIIDGNCLSDDEVTTGAIRGALKMQGLKISRKGELIGIDEVEKEIPDKYLVYDEDQQSFDVTTEEPSLADSDDYWIPIEGMHTYIRKSDYVNYTVSQWAKRKRIEEEAYQATIIRQLKGDKL